MQARRFFVAGAALCDVAFRDVVAGAAFPSLPRSCFFSFCSKKQLLEARSCFLEVSFLAASCFFQLPAAFFNFQEAASWPRSSF